MNTPVRVQDMPVWAELVDTVVRLRYPVPAGFTADEARRHDYMIRVALASKPELVLEDLRELLSDVMK